MEKEEIEARKAIWKRLNDELDYHRHNYSKARGDVMSFLPKIAPILRRTLHSKHYQVLKMRLEGHTLEEVGKKFGVTRERIRQIEARTNEALTPTP